MLELQLCVGLLPVLPVQPAPVLLSLSEFAEEVAPIGHIAGGVGSA
jgi:hypothetical protein